MRYEDRELLPATWGLVNSWAKDKKRAAGQINARAETIADRPAFRDAFQKRRCVVPADGFFEWTGPTGARQPLWYYRPDGGLLLFAGLYESWQPEPGQWERTFTIITTEANAIVREVHDRMPVILPEERINDWLFGRQENSEALRAMLVPAPDALLTVRHVSPRVNSAREDDPGVLEEVAVS
jgi:putative SOS response-associated peptidase YedK